LSQEQIDKIYKFIPVLSLLFCIFGLIHLITPTDSAVKSSAEALSSEAAQSGAVQAGQSEASQPGNSRSGDAQLNLHSKSKDDENTADSDKEEKPLLQLKNYSMTLEISKPPMEPWGVCSLNDQIICVSDRKTNTLLLFDRSGNKLNSPDSSTENSESKLLEPTGLASHQGNIYVADSGNNRIAVFDEKANFKFAFGKEGTENGQFTRPVGVCISNDGNVVVAQVDNSCVQTFSSEGKFISRYNLEKIKMDKLWGVAAMANGNFILTSALGGLTVYSPDFTPLYSLANRGSGQGMYLFTTGVAADNEGRVLVCAKTQGKIMIIKGPDSTNKRGKIEGEIYSMADKTCGPLKPPVIAATGSMAAINAVNTYRKKVISYPMDVSVTGDGMIIVAERGNGRVLVFKEE
jgi:DNA-binding beta-propeller fold protein YncE